MERYGIFDFLTCRKTQPGASFGASQATFNSGDSNIVREGWGGNAWLINAFAAYNVKGRLRIKGKSLHDDTNGIKPWVAAAQNYPLLPWENPRLLKANEALDVNMIGSTVSSDIELACLMVFYETPGRRLNNLITYEEYMSRKTGFANTVENTIVTPTSGDYATSEALNSEEAQFKPGRIYAILGGTVDVISLGVFYRGPETGNYRIGFPGNPNDTQMTTNFFVNMAKNTGLACIPTVSQVGAGTLNIDCVVDDGGADPVVVTHLELLN